MRLPILADEQLTSAQRTLKRNIQSGPRGNGATGGPFAIFLHAPAFGELAQRLGAHCRFGTSLSPRQSELAILVTASQWKSQYEWAAHAPSAARAGIGPDTIEALRTGREPTFEADDEDAIYRFIVELYRTKRVTDQTYARVHACLGNEGTVELTGILGYYAMLAMMLNVFRVPAPAGREQAFQEPPESGACSTSAFGPEESVR